MHTHTKKNHSRKLKHSKKEKKYTNTNTQTDSNANQKKKHKQKSQTQTHNLPPTHTHKHLPTPRPTPTTLSHNPGRIFSPQCHSNTMGLRTGLVLLAMLWAVSARPQRESTGGTAGEAPGAPPPEGFQALINRISGEACFV